MSKRTAEANKAIRLAWQRERELVQLGKGTRDWTEEQQKDILDPEKGKAYDDNGRAFEGQHMKSVEKYPEYQGEPENIQFLTKEEHLEAHQGSWQNPTNWYYDPISKQFTYFDEESIVACPIIDLSQPIINISINKSNNSADQNNNNSESDNPQIKKLEKSVNKSFPPTNNSVSNNSTPPPPKVNNSKASESNPSFFSKVGKKAKSFFTDYYFPSFKEHPFKTTIETLAAIGSVIKVTSDVKNSFSGNGSSSSNNGSVTKRTNTSPEEKNTDTDEYEPIPIDNTNSFPKEPSPKESEDNNEANNEDRPYTPNDVPAGGQHYHYKDGSVKWKEKAPYSRGKKKNDDE